MSPPQEIYAVTGGCARKKSARKCKMTTMATVAVCQNGAKKRVLDVFARLFGGFSGTACSACWNYLETEMKLRYYET